MRTRGFSIAVATSAFVIAVWCPNPAGAQPDLVTQGRQALEANRVEEALAILEKAVTADPASAAALAVQHLRAVVAMKEKNPAAVPDAVMPSVYLNLGLAHKKNGQPAEARAAWEKGRTVYPTAPETRAIEEQLRSF